MRGSRSSATPKRVAKRSAAKSDGKVNANGKAAPAAKAIKALKLSRAVGRGDDDANRGDRSKRLLDLVMMLLRARTPVTYRDVREQFPSYKTANVEAGLRAFERDKADLLELGVPIRYITPEEDDSLEDGGYVIDVKRFRMPEVRLTTDEISALVLAASVARAMPGGAYPKIVDLAVKKLAFDLPDLPDTPTEFPRPSGRATRPTVLVHFPEQRPAIGGDLSEHYATIETAIRFRKRVAIKYHTAANGTSTQRDVDPYALAYRDAAWLMIGYCHLRKEIRSFRVDRITTLAMAPKPKSPDFERPGDFDVRSYVQRSPWTFSNEASEEVELVLGPAAAEVANEDFGEATRTSEGDATVIAFRCGNPDFAVSRVLAAKGAITVRKGPRLKKRLADELTAVAARYE